MSCFLLIHGGSHGAWCWEQCIFYLQGLGHRAIAIDLPGHGADQTPRNQVTAASYVSAVRAFLDQQKGRSFTIVGHSLAGIFLPEVVHSHHEQIEEVVFLAAMVLEKGECAMDHVPEDRRPAYYQMAEASPDNSFLASYEVARRVFFHDLPEAEAQRAYERLTPQSIAVYLDKVNTSASEISIPKRYLVCRHDYALGYEPCLEFARKFGGPLVEIDAGHDVMLSQPKALAQILVAGSK